ncbi:MAG: RHS repeat-associated core domain-containing protein [Prevotellaceae bacterium]|nr:RHS repeat-associated core domain-containing protein [Prevotellaceae bacterium]
MVNGRIDKYQFEEGYCQAEKSSSDKNKDIFTFFYYDQDHLGNIRQVREANGSKGYVIQTMNYYPFGAEFCDNVAKNYTQKHKYNGKEFDNMHGLNSYDYGARQYNPVTARWDRIDPLCEKYYSVSPYVYCANNPVMLVDPDGRAWKPTQGENGTPSGYEWIDESNAYNTDGSLKNGLYHQAIFFSATGSNGETFNPQSAFNMGTSVATVYKADGSITSFDACTYPSDTDKYPTIPEKMLEAKVGLHQNKYPALRMSDIGTNNFYSSSIDLGFVSPSTGKTFAEGVNVHKPGAGNKTGICSDGRAVSKACFTIDIKRWDEFIGIFNNSAQKNNVISISVSRTLAQPTNKNYVTPVRNTDYSLFPIICPNDAIKVR